MNNKRPYIGRISAYAWRDKSTLERTQGLLMHGASGVAAHLTKAEAYALSDWITDEADKLTEPATAPQIIRMDYRSSLPLVAADGSPETPLPATYAEME